MDQRLQRHTVHQLEDDMDEIEDKSDKNDPLKFLTNQAPYLQNFNISGELPSAPASERCDLRHQRTKVELARLYAATDPA